MCGEGAEMVEVKKWLIVGALVLLAGYFDLLPFKSMDAGDLLVVETLLIQEEAGEVHLYAQDLEGTGTDVGAAADNMAENAPGQLFLRQTKRLIFCGDTQQDLLGLPEELPMGAVVYADPREAQELLEQMETLEAMLEAREKRSEDVPTLAQLQNRYLTEQKENQNENT
jgi:hypothetical protein